MRRRSLLFSAARKVEVCEGALDPPAAGQMLVQTLLSAISAGTEMLFFRGEAPPDLPLDSSIGALSGSTAYPLKYGYCAVGRVVEIGVEVGPGWQDRLVFAFNPHESHFLATPSGLIPLPEGITPEQALFAPNMETAINLVMDGGPLLGEQVIVLGQGVVGLLTTALLAGFPLARLITFDRYRLRREWSLRLGAQASLDPADPDALGQARGLLAASPGYPSADLTFELSGAPQALDTAIALTGFDGRVIVGSWYGQKRAGVDLGGAFHRSRIRLISSQVSTINPALQGRWDKRRRFDLVWQMIRKLDPQRLITHRIPFENAAQAYAQLDDDPARSLQYVLTYN